jgi:hypothetical protein
LILQINKRLHIFPAAGGPYGPVRQTYLLSKVDGKIYYVAPDGKNPEGISPESDHGKDVIGTTLKHCTITFCSRVTCQNNLVMDLPYSHGIWYDVGNVDGYFLNNWVEGVGNINRGITPFSIWPAQCGFFFEISKGAVCAGNVFVQRTNKKTSPMILWSPVMNNTCIIGLNYPAELHKLYPEFSASSSLYSDYTVFKSNELGNYRLLPEFPGNTFLFLLNPRCPASSACKMNGE